MLHAQVSEGEISVGVETSMVRSDTATRTYAALALGGGITWSIVGTPTLDIAAHTFPTWCFATNLNGDFDITQFHVPVGALVRFGELEAQTQRVTIGGGVGMGYQYTAGMLATGKPDLRPYFEVQIMLGLFKRGMLKVRYSTVMTAYADQAGSAVSYHALNVIGSTTW
jgi:hypothetical protein